MSEINTINLINQLRAMAAQAEGPRIETGSSQAPFNQVFQNALDQVSRLNHNADDLKTKFEKGDPNVSLAEVMVASQKSNIGFEATLRVRNKLVQAYQDIMNMPV